MSVGFKNHTNIRIFVDFLQNVACSMVQAWISSISTIGVGRVVIAASATWNWIFVVTKAVTIWNASMWTIVGATKSFEWSSTVWRNIV